MCGSEVIPILNLIQDLRVIRGDQWLNQPAIVTQRG